MHSGCNRLEGERETIYFHFNPENIRNCKDLESSLGLKVTRLFIAVKANSDWVIPSARGNRSAVV